MTEPQNELTSAAPEPDAAVKQKATDLTWFDSPIPEFPGRIAFPAYLTGRVYRRYVQVVGRARDEMIARAESDPDALVTIGVVVEEETDDDDAPRIGMAHYRILDWQAALALIARNELENLPAGWNDPTGEDAPLTLMAWVTETFKQWFEPLVTLKKSSMRSGDT